MGLFFNLGKCESSRFSRKRNSPVPSLEETPYTPGGHTLTVVPSQKDLEITVTNKLSWSPDTSLIVAKANRLLGFLRRNCSTYVGTNQKRLLYLTFVRSHLGYASEVWAPQSCVSKLRLLEGTQGRATRAILGCSSDPNLIPSYKSRLISLNLHPITPSATNLNLRPKSFRTSLFRDSFFNRIVPLWNNLPVLIRQSPTFLSFKTNLYKYYFCKLNSDFDTDRTRTWKTVYPHCRSINSLLCC